MSLNLKDLLAFSNIVIQCHDNPDADALASGFALKWYLEKNGKSPRFVYGGKFAASKSNLVLMIENLNIPVEYVTELEKPELLVTVDCQYGESNVTKFDAENIAVIDHHQVSGSLPNMNEVRSNYGSCATVMAELLKKEGIDYNEDVNIATALYYGLLTDTNGFAEISHPSDKDLRDFAAYNTADIVLFKNSNLSREELVIAGDALKHAKYNDTYAYSVVEAKPCDPNILGIISDMLLEVDSVKTCLVYSVLPFGVKISVRSCVKEVKASELAGYIADGLGGGGGHLVKAGGFLKKDLIEQKGTSYDTDCIKALMNGRMEKYFETSEIIYAGIKDEDISGYEKYLKHEVMVGYVKCKDIASPGSKVMIRTLEGDVDIVVEDDVYIVINVEGEIYPIKESKFERSYKTSDEPYTYPGEYSPSVIDSKSGKKYELLPYAKSAIAGGGEGIYAKVIDHRVKVFTSWDPDKYYLGLPGDYLAVRTDDLSDIYIIAKNIFEKTYHKG
ncbi:MAG: DHH family phosphoesterase [Lachnospiraceae bacterium]|nr:DHH family phosphoesterase [Lachnospiraceae bacterium]